MVLLGILGYDAGLEPQAVAALPRFHHQWMPDLIEMETDALSPATQQTLEAMGHRFKVPGNSAQAGRGSSHVWGNLQTVEWDKTTNTLMGGSDPRNPVGAAKVVETAASP